MLGYNITNKILDYTLEEGKVTLYHKEINKIISCNKKSKLKPLL